MAGSGIEVSYRQLENRSNQIAQLFRSLGARLGDHIAILMENCEHVLPLCFGAERAGLYYTALNTHLLANELAYIINDCGASIFIVSSRFAEVAEALRPKLAGVTHWFIVDGALSGYLDWQSSIECMPSQPLADENLGSDMLYSSGTTGRPKGIKWPLPGKRPGERTMLIDLLSDLYAYDFETRYLSPAPLYHAAPLRHSMTVIKNGGTVMIMEKFDALEALRLIERERITHGQWVPTMFVRMLKLPEDVRSRYDLSSQKFAIHAAAPCPVDVKERMINWWGPIIYEYYAGTENNGFCAINTTEWLSHKGSVGRAILGELHICDESGRELPLGAEGEVYFANGHGFSYHNDPVRTAAAQNEKGWTTLGDIGRLDAEGYLYLVDRKSFMIISGGVNIYPQEIEDVLLQHARVADAAVIGVPNEDLGEEVKAVVQLSRFSEASEALAAEIIAFCRDRLSAYKCPRSVDFMAELPRQPTGKLYKRLLRDKYRKA